MGLPKYKYTGVTAEGKVVEGEVEAKNERNLRLILRRQGIRAKKIQAPSALDVDLGVLLVNMGIIPPFSNKELGDFTRQFSTLINAGVPIVESLDILSRQQTNPSLKQILNEVLHSVETGRALHESLEGKKGFSKLYTSLVKAGESAGILDTILAKLAIFMEKSEERRKKVKGSLVYPAILISVGSLVTWGLLTFVVPTFVGMLTESGQEIPYITQLVIDTSDFLQAYSLYMILALFVCWLIFKQYTQTKQGKREWDRMTMQAPVFGGIIIKSSLASFTRTLGTMLSSGVSLLDSLDVCLDIVDNYQVKKDLTMVRDAVVKGKSISEPLKRIKYFPPLVTQMVKVGESTGNLDEMLIKVANVFDSETEELIDGMTKLVEPTILVGLGFVIGAVMIAMYLPVFMSAGGIG